MNISSRKKQYNDNWTPEIDPFGVYSLDREDLETFSEERLLAILDQPEKMMLSCADKTIHLSSKETHFGDYFPDGSDHSDSWHFTSVFDGDYPSLENKSVTVQFNYDESWTAFQRAIAQYDAAKKLLDRRAESILESVRAG